MGTLTAHGVARTLANGTTVEEWVTAMVVKAAAQMQDFVRATGASDEEAMAWWKEQAEVNV